MTDTIVPTLAEALATDSVNIDGVVSVLGRLGRGAVIHEKGICRLFGRSASAVRRAVRRGELPESTRLFGQCTWTVGALVDHIEERQRLARATAAHHLGDDDLHEKELRLRP